MSKTETKTEIKTEKVKNTDTVIVKEKLPVTVPNTPVKKPRKPREKVRDVEELKTVPHNKMSDKEKIKLLDYQEKLINELTNKNNELNNLVDSTFMQRRMDDENYKAMEQYYKTAMKSIDLQMNAAYSAIKNIVGGAN